MTHFERIRNGEDVFDVYKDVSVDELRNDIDNIYQGHMSQLTGISRKLKYEMVITKVLWNLQDYEYKVNKTE